MSRVVVDKGMVVFVTFNHMQGLHGHPRHPQKDKDQKQSVSQTHLIKVRLQIMHPLAILQQP